MSCASLPSSHSQFSLQPAAQPPPWRTSLRMPARASLAKSSHIRLGGAAWSRALSSWKPWRLTSRAVLFSPRSTVLAPLCSLRPSCRPSTSSVGVSRQFVRVEVNPFGGFLHHIRFGGALRLRLPLVRVTLLQRGALGFQALASQCSGLQLQSRVPLQGGHRGPPRQCLGMGGGEPAHEPPRGSTGGDIARAGPLTTGCHCLAAQPRV